jgi:hypothetical protein
MGTKKKKIGFAGLERKVYKEYRRKGYSAKTAKAWAVKTAGKVAARRKRHR